MSYIQKALELAEKGFDPLPIVDKRCFVKGWPDVNCQDEDLQAEWNRQWPDADVAARCTKLCVIDIDVKVGQRGLATWLDWKRNYGAMPTTRGVSTRSGGIHWYFQAPPWEITKKKFDGIDIKTGNAYVVAPPSVGYEWLNEFPLAPLPAKLKDLLAEPVRPFKPPFSSGGGDWAPVIHKMEHCPRGQRDNTLWRYLWTMAKAGASADDMFALCNAAVRAGLPKKQVEQKLKRVWV